MYYRSFTNKSCSLTARRVYFPLYGSMNAGYYSSLPYNAYQNQFSWIKKKSTNTNYCLLINLSKEMRDLTRTLWKFTSHRYKLYRFRVLQEYLYVYNTFFSSCAIDLFYARQFFKTRYNRTLYYLIFSFFKNKLFINLQNYKKKNYTFVSPGLFIKFFEKKKSLKKTKTIKFLMAKYLRKLFIISKITNIILILKNNPSNLTEILKLINTPIVHKFVDPIEHKEIDESGTKIRYFWVKFLFFIFSKNISFSNNKMRKRGRIKRKILRKLVLENRLID